MKKLMLGMLMIISQQLVMAQATVKGIVSEKETGNRLAFISAEIDNVLQSVSNEHGEFIMKKLKPGKHKLKLSGVGYKTSEFDFEVKEETFVIQFQIEKQVLFLNPVEVTAIRANDRMPFTKTNLNKKEIEKMNTGQDLPFILNQTPSVVINSDAGNGIGYTGIRIRGTDATRINMTLNGIPYNDAESQGLFFVNLPDFASSVNSIQIQRGVGTSSNGAGAFGATLNLSTNEFNEKPYAELNNGFGSFSSWRHTIKAGSGLIGKHFTIDGRVSFINSDGFIERGASDLRSAYLSAAYINKKTSLRLNAFTGKEKTYQAWNGIPEAKLRGDEAKLLEHYNNNYYLYDTKEDSANLFNPNNNRTYNYFRYGNQTDNYRQDHYQLLFNHEINKSWNINTAFFLTRGLGYYEEYKRGESLDDYGLNAVTADIIRQLWLDNYFYGATFSAQYKRNNDQLTFGGAYTRYDGKHYGKIVWSEVAVPKDYKWYNLTAFKTDFNFYTKYQRRLNSRWEAFADVQYRNVNHTINGFRKNPSLQSGGNFNFINPKLGISYANGNGWLGFASFSIGNKEPNRDDFEAGVTQKPKHETLYDFEVNIEQRKAQYNWSVTGYYMHYNNQLVLTGKVNDVGGYTRTNAPKSYRAGVELQAGVKPISWFNANANLTLSKNRILNFTEFVDDYDNGGQQENKFASTPLSFSPSAVAGFTLNFIPVKNGEISLLNKYVSRQYLDNTGNDARSINPFYVTDLRLSYQLRFKKVKEVNFNLQLNNLFNRVYETNGYTFGYIYGGQTITENYYYPMAGTNFMAGINIKI
ncbi:TonB-dependent receptor [Lacibacter luteus]|uniref:TonB-dependent receptor n=2 Tax=Lacibacter luteus TaxID=2508719 RepID=A0A4Q1CN87_9BACT|nr:TonB-dependent receptor [Lacibacter luteus]